MATTTIRVDRETHERLSAIARGTGRQLMDVVRDATDALERARFAQQVSRELLELRGDEDAWREYVGDAELAVGDGIT